ncbi:transcription factor E4F1 isoform X1 [Cherax quadricarinatus]
MKYAEKNEGCTIPVVHLRIVHDRGFHKYACDFCRKSFDTSEALSQHVNYSHTSLNIQEVYICPSCRCCVLSHNDLLDHLSLRHHVQIDNREDSTLCEYCGLKLTSQQCLLDHVAVTHCSGVTESSFIGIVELSIKDISNMGMGNPDCKTLFQVIEVSLVKYKENLPDSVKIINEDKCVKNDSLITRNEDMNIVFENTLQQCNGNINVKSPKESESSASLTRTVDGYTNTCSNSFNELISETNLQDCESQLEMTICCDTDEKPFVACSPGEIILTVESEEELVWSQDVMSQVICSSGILNRTQGSIATEGNGLVTKNATMQQATNDWNADCSVEVKRLTQEQQPHSAQLLDPIKNDASKTLEIIGVRRRAEKEKVCIICKQLFSHLGDLEQHENRIHGIRIKCDLCDDSFVFSKSLRNHHLRKHTGSADFKCKDCDKVFKCRSNLWSHRLTHLSQEMRRFQCLHCSQRFTTKSKLNIHLQSHTGEKKFQCGECQKGFVSHGLLMRHMKKHVSETCSIVLGALSSASEMSCDPSKKKINVDIFSSVSTVHHLHPVIGKCYVH